MPIHHVEDNGSLREDKVETAKTRLLLRSDRVQEIISRRPGFVERWGLLLFLLILCLLLAGSWLISYPDVIETNATLISANAPKELVTRQDGKLIKLFVVNDESVQQGQMIGWIESTANHPEVIALSDLLNKTDSLLETQRTEKVSGLFNHTFYNLGDLQVAYQQFITAWLQFNDYLVNGYYYKKKGSLDQDYAFLKKMHLSLDLQLALTQKDLKLANEAFEANDSLFRDSVISKQDLRDQGSRLIGKQMNLQQLASTILTNEGQQIGKQRDIDELEHTISQQKIIFHQALKTLKSLCDGWTQKYILKAPVAGKVFFLMPLQENQFLQAGKTIGFVDPPDSRYYAQVTLPQNNFGKIRLGQRVLLRLDAYPYQEFGSIEGRLAYVSKVPSDSGFLANIDLPNGLHTNYKKELQYRSGLKSQALIITRNSRLIQRLMYNITKATTIK